MMFGGRTSLASRHSDVLARERAFEFGRLLEKLLLQHPDADLATIRLEETPATNDDPPRIRITGDTR